MYRHSVKPTCEIFEFFPPSPSVTRTIPHVVRHTPENDGPHDFKCTDMVPLNAKAPYRLRATMKARTARGPDVQVFIAAACLRALRNLNEETSMLDDYEAWVKRGCPEIVPAKKPREANAREDDSQGGKPQRRAG